MTLDANDIINRMAQEIAILTQRCVIAESERDALRHSNTAEKEVNDVA